MSQRLAYLGPPGTYSEEAALLYAASATLVSRPSFATVVQVVEAGEADEGIVPIENSIEGTVAGTVDLLIHETRLKICEEVVLPIEHQLVAGSARELAAIEVIYSHPQALGQCRRHIDRHFPKAQVIASLSTTAAVEEALVSPRPAAAITTARAAEIYGTPILASGISDVEQNETRFVVLAHQDRPPTGDDKTSICFTLPGAERAGTLVEVLSELADRQISMTKIESRPAKESLGKYIFLVDLEGHRADPLVAEALERIRAKSGLYKLFGSYPRFRAAPRGPVR